MAIKLDYWRADNMWAAAGGPTATWDRRPSPSMPARSASSSRTGGTSSSATTAPLLRQPRAQTHQQRHPEIEVKLNNFDGILPSLLQKLTNRATKGYIRLDPGQTVDIKSDIQEVYAPKA